MTSNLEPLMNDELTETPAKPHKPLRRASTPKASRAYKDRYEALKDKEAAMAMRIQTALTLLKSGGDNTCDGNVLKAAIGLLEGK